MNVARMIKYVDHIAEYITETSLLIMDRLSSHTAGTVRQHIHQKKLPSGEAMFIPIFIPAKTAFLISPLDMGAIGAFKSQFHKLNRHTLKLKIESVHDAWGRVSNSSLVSIFKNCGLVGKESMSSLRQRFMKEVGSLVPSEIEPFQTFYDAWNSGTIDVDGANRHRGVRLDRPKQLPEGHLDGLYWSNYGGNKLFYYRMVVVFFFFFFF